MSEKVLGFKEKDSQKIVFCEERKIAICPKSEEKHKLQDLFEVEKDGIEIWKCPICGFETEDYDEHIANNYYRIWLAQIDIKLVPVVSIGKIKEERSYLEYVKENQYNKEREAMVQFGINTLNKLLFCIHKQSQVVRE